jgi:glycosyltransferase involved in cell wall biosynthesis
MKIILVTEAFGPKGFGVGQVLSRLIKLYRDYGIVLKVHSPFIEDTENLLTAEESVVVPYVEKKFLWHPWQVKFFEREIAAFNPDLIHIHGVFTFIQRSAVQAAFLAGVPLLLSPHGMLNPSLLPQRSDSYTMLKRLYWATLMKPVLRKIDYVHVITEIEAACLAQEFPTIPQMLIPNAIDINLLPNISMSRSPEKIFVFLGRLHPKKGVDLLIRAFKTKQLERGWRLVIAGPDFDAAYGQQLRRLAMDLDLADRVDFIGPVYGEEKYALLTKAWAVVVPSYSEVVALVNLESSAVGTPTITTTGTGLHDWAESGGLLIETAIEPLTQALQSAAEWTLEERQARGTQARAFVQERYNWQSIGSRWIEAYKNIATRTIN